LHARNRVAVGVNRRGIGGAPRGLAHRVPLRAHLQQTPNSQEAGAPAGFGPPRALDERRRSGVRPRSTEERRKPVRRLGPEVSFTRRGEARTSLARKRETDQGHNPIILGSSCSPTRQFLQTSLEIAYLRLKSRQASQFDCRLLTIGSRSMYL